MCCILESFCSPQTRDKDHLLLGTMVISVSDVCLCLFAQKYPSVIITISIKLLPCFDFLSPFPFIFVLFPTFCLILSLRFLFIYFSPPSQTPSSAPSFLEHWCHFLPASFLNFLPLHYLCMQLNAQGGLFITAIYHTVPRPWGFFSPLLFSCRCLHVLPFQSSLLVKLCFSPGINRFVLQASPALGTAENAEYWEMSRCKSQENGPSQETAASPSPFSCSGEWQKR